MKKELEEKLINKYRNFFTTERKIYTSDNTIEVVSELIKQKEVVLPIQFGIECGDGWYMLLDELMNSIQNYITNYNRNAKYALKYDWLTKFSWFIQKNINKKLGIWIRTSNTFTKGKQKLYFQIDQIKEKMGGLRFYYSGGDKAIEGMIDLAESLSYNICEYCGSTLNIGHTQGWISTICKDCLEKTENRKNLKWIIKN